MKRKLLVVIIVLSLVILMTGCEKTDNDNDNNADYTNDAVADDDDDYLSEEQVIARARQYMELVQKQGEYERSCQARLAECQKINADYVDAQERDDFESGDMEWHCGYYYRAESRDYLGQLVGYYQALAWDSLRELKEKKIEPMRLRYIN